MFSSKNEENKLWESYSFYLLLIFQKVEVLLRKTRDPSQFCRDQFRFLSSLPVAIDMRMLQDDSTYMNLISFSLVLINLKKGNNEAISFNTADEN